MIASYLRSCRHRSVEPRSTGVPHGTALVTADPEVHHLEVVGGLRNNSLRGVVGQEISVVLVVNLSQPRGTELVVNWEPSTCWLGYPGFIG